MVSDLGVDKLQRPAVLLEIQQLLLDAPEGGSPLARASALPVLLQRLRHILQLPDSCRDEEGPVTGPN